MSRLLILVLLLFAASPLAAGLPGGQRLWLAEEAGAPAVRLYFFWSSRCPHCQEARPFVESLPRRYPWVELESYELLAHPEHRLRYLEFAALLGIEGGSVPTFLWCGRHEIGWAGEAVTGARLIAGLKDCYRRHYGEPPPDAAQADPAPAADLTLPWLGGVEAGSLSLPALTLVLGGLDAFNPCAFFILLFLLSLLVHARSRRAMLLVGGVFVFISGLVYFLFMAAWLNVFRWLGELQAVTRAAGALAVAMALLNVKDYFWFRRGPSLTLSEAQKASLFARMRRLLASDSLPALLGGTVLLAVAANSYELLCTAGFPMVYTRILTLNHLSPAAYYVYLLLYNVVYVLPLLIIVLAFAWTLGRRRLSESEGRRLKLLSGLMMLGLGGLLLIAPELLDHLLTALLLPAAALALTAAVAAVERWVTG